ncbi:MAG: toxin-antitoxin system HicB family antitoxin [Nocardioidaceae bacterium]|jgi:hypothetical protein|nr:toxin-antitoxin system HicB family antitoxin [Nocardioidaceae bacterium]
MDLAPYVDRLRNDLADAAAAGGPQATEAAQRLALALDPAVRMTLMEALSDAAAEITAELHTAAVDVRLRGREPEFIVHQEPAAAALAPIAPTPPAPPTPPSPDGEAADRVDEGDGTVARVTVRIPDSLKVRAEELAAERSQSLNSWIVQAIRSAAFDRSVELDIGTISVGGRNPTSKRVQGWSR